MISSPGSFSKRSLLLIAPSKKLSRFIKEIDSVFEEDNTTFHVSNINYVSKQMIKIIRVKIKMIYVYRFFNIELFK